MNRKQIKSAVLIAISSTYLALAIATGIFSGAGLLPIMLRFAFAAPIFYFILHLTLGKKGR